MGQEEVPTLPSIWNVPHRRNPFFTGREDILSRSIEIDKVDILFQDRKLEKVCNNQSLLVRRYGPLRAKLFARRLVQLRAAENLEVMRSLPQVRCHELKGNREGTLAVDLEHPYRLIFEPANEIIQKKAAITAETALQLEQVLHIPASFWLKLEQYYRESLARLAEEQHLDVG